MALPSAFVQRLSGLFILKFNVLHSWVNFPHYLFANFLPFIFSVGVWSQTQSLIFLYSSAFHLLVFCPYFLGHFLNFIFQSFYQTKFCIQSYFSFSGTFLAPCMFCSSNNLVLFYEDKPQITPTEKELQGNRQAGDKGNL